MSLFDLFKEHKPEVDEIKYPETAQDGGTPAKSPNMDPAYFKPAYPTMVPVGVLPTTEHPDSHWLQATKQGKFIPYIGEEPHGVEIDVDPSKIPVNDIDLIAARGHAFGTPVGEPHSVPVPVTIIDTPVLFGVEKKISTNTFTLTAGVPILLCAKRPERSRVQLNVSTVGPAIIGDSKEQVLGNVGYIVPLGVMITFITNQAVWVISSVAAVVSVLEEFTIVEGAKRV